MSFEQSTVVDSTAVAEADQLDIDKIVRSMDKMEKEGVTAGSDAPWPKVRAPVVSASGLASTSVTGLQLQMKGESI